MGRDEKKNQTTEFAPKKIAGNTAWIMSKTIYSSILSFVIGAISARYLGPENYGLLGYGTAYINIFLAITRFGLNSFIINDIVKNKEKTDTIIGSAVFFRVVLSCCSILFIYILMIIIEPGDTLVHVIVFLQSLVLLFDVFEVFEYWFKAQMLAKFVSIAAMCGYTATGVFKIILLVKGASVVWFALSGAIEAAVILIIVAACFFKQSGARLQISKETLSSFYHRGKHMVITAIGVSLYLQCDRIMLKKMTFSSEIVGYYTIALAVATMWEFIPSAVIETATPIIIKNKLKDEDKYIKSFQALLCLITVMSIVVGVGFICLGGPFIKLVYGNQYINSIAPMNIIIWSTGFAMVGTARGIWMVQEGLYKYSKYYIFIAAISNIILNYLMIPLWGANGAAIATLLTQFISAVAAPALFKPTREFVKIYLTSFKRLPSMIDDLIR